MADNDTPPQGVMPLLGDAGPAPTVAFNKKTWTIGHPTQRAKAELEKLVVDVSRQNLEDLKDVLSPGEWQAERKQLSLHIHSRAWQTFGELWNAVVNGPLGDVLFLLSLARPHHPDMTVADARALWLGVNDDCRDALTMVVPSFFDLLAGEIPASDADRRKAAGEMKAELLRRLARPTPTA